MPADSTPSLPVARPIDARTSSEALYRAVSAARLAPSAGNAQPWRWQLSEESLDLFLEPGRVAPPGVPGDRLARIACGAALHNAALALTAEGWRTTVTRHPDRSEPGHLARLRIAAVARIGRRATHSAQHIHLRHTDPRPVTGEPLRAEDLAAVRKVAQEHGALLRVLRPDEILQLVLASEPAARSDSAEAQWYGQLAQWAGRDRIVGGDGAGSPRQAGTHDRAATFVALHGPGDEQLDWLRAGEALSAAWLLATTMGLSVLPFSAPIECPAARQSLRRIFGDSGHPYLVVRLGRHSGPSLEPHSPRLPIERILTVREGQRQ